MNIIKQWAEGYLLRNYTDVFQGIVFALLTVRVVFHRADPGVKIRKGILSFLVSCNTSQLLSSFAYAAITSFARRDGTLWDFFLACVCLLYPLLLLIPLYRKIIGVSGPIAILIYTLFFSANCMAMLIAMTTLQRLLITIALSLLLVRIFWGELQYVLTRKSMLQTDKKYSGTAIAFMILIGLEAELPRIVINGGEDTVGNQLAYAVAIVGAVLILLFVIFTKFNFFAIQHYEDYIRRHDDDQMTSAKSLSYLLGHGPEWIRRTGKNAEPMAVFYTNISNMRDFNAMYGFDTGSELLQKIAAALTEQFPNGIIARTSGTHFTGLIPANGSREIFCRVIRQAELLSIGETLHLRVGIRPLEEFSGENAGDISPMDLFSLIDQSAGALRHLPESESGVQYFDAALRHEEEIRVYVLANVDEAVRSGWLQNYYQPIICCRTDRIAGYEALSRWIDPKYGFLTPDRFIVPLEKERLIYKVDLHILRDFGAEYVRVRRAGGSPLPISMNLSRTDLEAEFDVLQELENIVQTLQIPKEMVHIEITESAMNGNSSVMGRAVQRIHEMGFEVWMDDFGAGYSSLNVLKDYQFDVIKIDMEFMRTFDSRSKEIVASICRMANSIGTRTVAEGVETEEQYAFLKSVGCTYAQGYLFSKPVPGEEAVRLQERFGEGGNE